MRRVIAPIAISVAILATGCGEKDPNKDLKPVGKDAPKPTVNDKTGGTMKATTTPP